MYCFRVDARTESLGRLNRPHIGRGVLVPDGKSLLVLLGLGQYTANFGFAGFGLVSGVFTAPSFRLGTLVPSMAMYIIGTGGSRGGHLARRDCLSLALAESFDL